MTEQADLLQQAAQGRKLTGREQLGILVRCRNCRMVWRRVTANDNPGGTVPWVDVQYRCPGCQSNAWVPVKEKKP